MYASSGRSTSGSMSFRVRSVSGRRRVPCPPTRMTAGRLIAPPARCPRTRSRRFECVRVEHVAPVDEQPVPHARPAAAQSSSRSSGHSVTITAASAPSSASSAEPATATPSSCALPSATGSHALTSAPSAWSRPARTRLGASRMSSVPGLKASPRSAIFLPRSEPRRRSSFPITRRFWSSLTSITAFRSWKLYPEFAASCLSASESFGKQLPPKPIPARKNEGPMRRSRPMPSATVRTSAPVASQTFAISLMKEIRVTSAAFAASLIISADATSQRTTGASMPACSRSTTSASACRTRR